MAKILLIEDESDNRDLIRIILEMNNHQIIECVTGEDGIISALSERPDLLLMDISLPGTVDGLEATRRLRADSSFDSTPILALTAHAMRGDRENSLAAGCDDHIVKPIEDLNLFAETIEFYLHNGRVKTKNGVQP